MEMFGAGTACVVSPISLINYMDQNLHIPTTEQTSALYKIFLKHMSDIQYGYIPTHPWAYPID